MIPNSVKSIHLTVYYLHWSVTWSQIVELMVETSLGIKMMIRWWFHHSFLTIHIIWAHCNCMPSFMFEKWMKWMKIVVEDKNSSSKYVIFQEKYICWCHWQSLLPNTRFIEIRESSRQLMKMGTLTMIFKNQQSNITCIDPTYSLISKRKKL